MIDQSRVDDVEAALDAVFGNVFAHTPPGTGYRIRLHSTGAMGELTVSDDGPGIASPELLRRGTSGGDSTGLGVDIVRALAEDIGGRAEWTSGPSGGTTVRLELPAVSAP